MDTVNADTVTPSERAVGTGTPGLIVAPELEEQQRSVSPLRAAFRRFLRDKRAVFCLGVVLFMVLFSFIFPPIYQHLGPTVLGGATGTKPVGPGTYHQALSQDLTYSDTPGTLFPLGPNSLFHPLGTDALGRDMLARLMFGVNVSVELALLVEVLDIVIGLTLGALAGWYGGWLGTLLDRFTDIMFAFPSLLLILLMSATLGPLFDQFFHNGLIGRLLLLTLALGLVAWPLMMRLVRGQTLLLKEQQFIEAARTVGTSNTKIILRHIVPNVMNVVVVAATLDVLATIIGEAGISVLGAGIQPPNASLGLMISEGRPYIPTPYWAELFWPALTLIILVVCLSFIGDGVRDAFDPRTKD